MRYRIPAGIGVLVLFSHLSAAQPDAATRSLARDVFQQLIEINTTDSVGSTTVAAQAMAKRLLDAGFPAADVKVLGPNDRKGNMVVRLHGTGAAKPILIIGHLDVVEARREDWTTDPFQFVEKDGYFYGRGTQDMKVNDAILVVTLIRFQREGYRPNRDIILALTADEEGGSFNGVDWLLKNHRDLIDAGFVLNADAGGILTEKGKPIDVEVEATEKLYADFQLTAKNPGGHSSLPIPDNAIYHIADALGRLERSPFPFELNPVTRAYFEQLSKWRANKPPLLCWPSCRRRRIRKRSRVFRKIRTTTRWCAPPASPRGSTPVTPTTRCRRPRRPWSTAGSCRGIRRKRSGSNWFARLRIPR
jgi:acetylornithine deacetylase/succinyl-diaminopimelate desuccinylase-like protein